MKFSELIYTRPDHIKVMEDCAAITARFKNAKSFEEAEEILFEMEKLQSAFSTQSTIANIRHNIDTTDEFYDAEVKFLDEVEPQLEEYLQEWSKAFVKTPFRPQFEEKYGDTIFINKEIELKAFSPEIISELQQENALVTEYAKIIASAQIPFEDGVYTLSQLTPFKQDPNDERRLKAWQAEGRFYKKHQARLDAIYDELTHLRDQMGRKLGYDGYTQLGYYRMLRNCYTKEDVEKFRAAVRKYLVPVADEIYKKQAKRLGKTYPMNFADNALEYRTGNAKPCGTAEDILAHGKKFYHELSQESAEFIDMMYDSELLDVLSKKGKAGGGYCTCLHDYAVPFIFANFNGTSGDVEVMTHEAGHAFANFVGRDVPLLDYRWPSMEACEVHSMSMEFFSWPWAEGFFGKDTQKFYYSHLASALTFIPYGTMVDHFQHIVFEKPNMTPGERHDTWRELLGVYMPWMKLDDEIPFYGEGEGWQRQSHIYQRPFYYIDYCLAQTMSLQFWAMLMKDKNEAWETYMKYTRPAGTKTFTQLIEEAGLESPFGDECLKNVCAAAAKWLDEFDMSKLQ